MAGQALKRIGTHNGRFHVDEVLGCFMLRQLPEYKDAEIVRSRDPKVLEGCDIVIDVGAVYCHEKKRYDHHQREFNETLETITGVNQSIKLSSAGLIFAHYGLQVIESISPKSLTKEEADQLYYQVYIGFVREIDAKDNGIDICDPPQRYKICTDISSRVGRLNPTTYTPHLTEEGQFKVAYDIVGSEFKGCIEDLITMWLPTRKYISEALDNRFNVDKSGMIIEINAKGVPWPSHLQTLEMEREISPQILFVVYSDSKQGWRVQAVSRDGGFELRSKVLPNCTGLRDELLVSECGVPDAFFVHANGFIGGAKSRDGALKMAVLSLPNETVP